MANSLYDHGRDAFLNGSINYTSDTIAMAMIGTGYTPNLATHQFLSDVGSNILASAVNLTGKTTTAGTADCSSVTFGTVSTGTVVQYLLLYKATGTATTSPLIGLIDTATGLPLTGNGGTVAVMIDPVNDLFTL